MKIHPTVNEVTDIITQAGKQIYLVGGAVRDILRGRKSKDWDLATDATPDEIIALFHRKKTNDGKNRSLVIPTGIKHGTVTIHYRDLNIEITTFRCESSYSDGRRPDSVEFGVSIEEDLSRRDFTMNAAAYKLPGGPLVDPFDGRKDIKNRVIRCVGNPLERFSEDGLRPVRAVRFASQLDFSVDKDVLDAIPESLAFTAKVASERIREELDKIIASDKPSAALLLMEQTGLMKLLIPELAACRGVMQERANGSGFHRFDVLDHSLLACDFAAREKLHSCLRLAALFHDIGKPGTAKTDGNGEISFHRHEKLSSSLARQIMLRFKYPNAVMSRVCHLVEEHMFHYEDSWTDAAVRRFIIRAGEENLPDLFALRRADFYGMAKKEPPYDLLLPLRERITEVLAQKGALSLKDLAISGKDLMALNIPAEKRMGIILGELLDAVLDDPALNTREKLLEIAGNLNKRYS